MLKDIRKDLEYTKDLFENQEILYRDQLHIGIEALHALENLSSAPLACLEAQIAISQAQNGLLELTLTMKFFSKYASNVRSENRIQAKERIKMHVEIRDAIANKIRRINEAIAQIEDGEG